jgi:hypothetical protein
LDIKSAGSWPIFNVIERIVPCPVEQIENALSSAEKYQLVWYLMCGLMILEITARRECVARVSLAVWVGWVPEGATARHPPGECSLPFKANADRRHRIPKQRFRATNWAEYDAALRGRGSLTVWGIGKLLSEKAGSVA